MKTYMARRVGPAITIYRTHPMPYMPVAVSTTSEDDDDKIATMGFKRIGPWSDVPGGQLAKVEVKR